MKGLGYCYSLGRSPVYLPVICALSRGSLSFGTDAADVCVVSTVPASPAGGAAAAGGGSGWSEAELLFAVLTSCLFVRVLVVFVYF